VVSPSVFFESKTPLQGSIRDLLAALCYVPECDLCRAEEKPSLIRRGTTIDEFILRMNAFVVKDREGARKVFFNRIPMVEGSKIVGDHNHPIQVFVDKETGKASLSLLGLINGLWGSYDDGPKKGYGPIAANFDDDTNEFLGFIFVPNM
jgi:hypothetical protein